MDEIASPGPTPGRVRFKTLGCKVNRVESDAASRALAGEGWRVVEGGLADVVVVNTCTVTAEADSKARKEIRRALAAPDRPTVVVTGCLAVLAAEELSGISERVVVEADRGALAARVAGALAGRCSPGRPASGSEASTTRTRAMVKVQDGCDQRCTYCIVPDARGLPRSRPFADVLSEVGLLAGDGVGEIVLTGVNIGTWRDGDADLAQLVDAACEIAAGRIRLSSIEPTHLSEDFLQVAARRTEDGSLCPHFHVPLQSGSDPILVAMRRPYDSAGYAAAVASLREAVPRVALTTDVIAGFPGETLEQAEESRVFVERVGFQRLHVFRYSERPGTPAALITPRVPVPERSARAARLRDLSGRLLAGYTARKLGQRARVLVEEDAMGTTEDYIRVAIAGARPCAGSLIDAVLGLSDGRAMMTATPQSHAGLRARQGEHR
jgi:threonylcarbamoyladenosine tRNA methylthiotransferase MtaB